MAEPAEADAEQLLIYARDVSRLLDETERYLGGQEYELVRAERQVVTLDD